MSTAGDAGGAGPERAWCEALPANGTDVVLDREESGHLVRVRRVGEGDDVVLFDGRGALRRGRLVGADARAARVHVLGPYPARHPVRDLEVRASLPEPSRADDLVAALAELGVRRFVALACRRTPPGRDDLLRRRLARFARAAREALKVNGLAQALEVHPEPRPFAAALEGRGWLLDTAPGLPPLGACVAAATAGPLVLWVGPEGGFAPDEREAAHAAGLGLASLGGAALRTATAAVAAAAVVLASAPPTRPEATV